MKTQTIQVNARKYDGSIHRSWRAELIEAKDQFLVLRGVFENNVDHPDLGAISKGTVSYEYYWLDRWYNVFRFYEPNGKFRNHYCNVNLPPTFNNSELDYIDLDLDIIVDADWKIKVLDLQEFRNNASIFSYDKQTISTALEQIDVLTRLINAREFPFTLKVN